jgi:hypothetical protein
MGATAAGGLQTEEVVFHPWNGTGHIRQRNNFRPAARWFADPEDQFSTQSRLAADVLGVFGIGGLRVANPDLLISSYRKAYQIDKATGKWSLLGTAKTDARNEYFGNYETTHLGSPRVVRFGSNDFFSYPAGDSLAIYRIEPPAGPDRGPTV